MPGILLVPGWEWGCPPVQEEFCLREQQMCLWGPVLVGTAVLGQFGVTQRLHGAFAPVGRVGTCEGQRRGGGIRATPCPAPSRSSFHPAGFGGCWPTCGAGRAVPGPGPAPEAALSSSAAQTDSVASAPTSKPSSSSPPRDSLTPGPGPSSAIPLRPPPAKAPSTDTVSECLGTAGSCSGGGGSQGSVCHQQSWQGRFAPQNQPWPTGAPLPLPHCHCLVGLDLLRVVAGLLPVFLCHFGGAA